MFVRGNYGLLFIYTNTTDIYIEPLTIYLHVKHLATITHSALVGSAFDFGNALLVDDGHHLVSLHHHFSVRGGHSVGDRRRDDLLLHRRLQSARLVQREVAKHVTENNMNGVSRVVVPSCARSGGEIPVFTKLGVLALGSQIVPRAVIVSARHSCVLPTDAKRASALH